MKSFLQKFVKARDVDVLQAEILSVACDIAADDASISVQVNDSREAVVVLEVDASRGAALEGMRQAVEAAVVVVDGVQGAQVILTAEAKAPAVVAPPPAAEVKDQPALLAHVKKVILVASGKGGVGKSTVAANLAVGLGRTGRSVGLMDADIYGPSQPRMMGVEGQKPDGEQGRIEPLIAHGVKVMSIGLMVDSKDALVWRGPIVQKALMQMLRDTVWGTEEAPLDVLIVDMPPGTGDVQLSLAQKVEIGGAIIVSTPQDIALIDARKGVEMFRKVDVPVLGVVENMSTHICSKCGHEEHVFGHGGARDEAKALGVPFLGEIPLHGDIRSRSDAGEFGGTHFDELSARVADMLSDE